MPNAIPFPPYHASVRGPRFVFRRFYQKAAYIVGGNHDGPEAILLVEHGRGVQVAEVPLYRDCSFESRLISEDAMERMSTICSGHGKDLTKILKEALDGKGSLDLGDFIIGAGRPRGRFGRGE